ncbi:MAG: hypothetical protein HY329_10120 [Chloroflexi bacterium]|nr:hypothetical protein [Chloroflexota bacterium]
MRRWEPVAPAEPTEGAVVYRSRPQPAPAAARPDDGWDVIVDETPRRFWGVDRPELVGTGTVFLLVLLLMFAVGTLLMYGITWSETPVSVPTAFPRGL